jgi:hypothetical protein
MRVLLALLLGLQLHANAFAQMPREAPLGVINNHLYELPGWFPPRVLFTIYTPMPSAQLPGHMLDLALKRSSEVFPRRFIMGDGGSSRPFMWVDLRPGSELRQQVAATVADLQRRGMNVRDRESVYRALQTQLGQYLSADTNTDPQPSREWLSREARAVYDAMNVPDPELSGTKPVSAQQSYPVIAFESYFSRGNAVCIQKALLAAFILEELRIPHRFVTGFAAPQPGGPNTGHSWIETLDGRVLDPEQSLLEHPIPHDDYPLFLKAGLGYRQRNLHYPYFVPNL